MREKLLQPVTTTAVEDATLAKHTTRIPYSDRRSIAWFRLMDETDSLLGNVLTLNPKYVKTSSNCNLLSAALGALNGRMIDLEKIVIPKKKR